jgi:hypothetical protein
VVAQQFVHVADAGLTWSQWLIGVQVHEKR